MRILVFLVFLNFANSETLGPWGCVKSVWEGMRQFYSITNDLIENGPWFNKQQLIDTFYSTRKIYQECQGKIPKMFKLENCLFKTKEVLDSVDKMAYLVDIEAYDDAYLEYLKSSWINLQSINICLNTKAFDIIRRGFKLKGTFSD